jgi:KDO2-lipid IV(A) lauroyltransferase
LNSLRERILGTLLTALPNRKFAATEMLAADSSLVGHGKPRALVRANAVFVWSYYLRLLGLSSRRRRERAYRRVVVRGEENLHSAVSRGRGVLLLSVHLGDFDLGGGWLAERCGVTPVVCTRPLRPAWRHFLFSAARRRLGVLLRNADETRIETLEADLHRNCAVLVMLDRRPRGFGSPSRILDRASVVPHAVGALAARTGAPLVAAASWRGPNGDTLVWFGEPATAVGPDQAMAHIASAADRLSQLIHAHPEQWHVPADLEELSWSARIKLGDSATKRISNLVPEHLSALNSQPPSA